MPDKLAAALAEAPPSTAQAITWDGPAGARVTAAGARALIVDFRLNGARHRKVLPTMNPAKARKMAAEWKALAKRGIDPTAPTSAPVRPARSRSRPIAAPATAPASESDVTFRAAAEAFLAHGRKKKGKVLRPRTRADYEAALLVQAAPLHARPLGAIRRAEIARLIGDVAREKAARAQRSTRSAGPAPQRPGSSGRRCPDCSPGRSPTAMPNIRRSPARRPTPPMRGIGCSPITSCGRSGPRRPGPTTSP